MARASMGQLIDRVRTLIVDTVVPASGAQFTDDQMQDALDLHRSDMRFVPLRPMPTFLPGATVLFYDYYSDLPNWEADVQLQDTSFNTITATTSEYLVGHWQFAAQPNGIGVRATGKVYDVYGACADLLEAWAGALANRFDFASDQQSFKLSQLMSNKLALAARYRALAQPAISRMVQADAWADTDGGGIVYPNYALENW